MNKKEKNASLLKNNLNKTVKSTVEFNNNTMDI